MHVHAHTHSPMHLWVAPDQIRVIIRFSKYQQQQEYQQQQQQSYLVWSKRCVKLAPHRVHLDQGCGRGAGLGGRRRGLGQNATANSSSLWHAGHRLWLWLCPGQVRLWVRVQVRFPCHKSYAKPHFDFNPRFLSLGTPLRRRQHRLRLARATN